MLATQLSSVRLVTVMLIDSIQTLSKTKGQQICKNHQLEIKQ